MAKNCHLCGTLNQDGSDYCEMCGIDLSASPAAAPQQPPAPEPAPVTAAPTTASPAASPAPPQPTVSPSTTAFGGVTGIRAGRLHRKLNGIVEPASLPLQASPLVIGRFDPSSGPVDLDLSGVPGNEHVSRRHAEFSFDGTRWRVRDLGAANGVFIKRINETNFSSRIQDTVDLSDGDEVALGSVIFVFREA